MVVTSAGVGSSLACVQLFLRLFLRFRVEELASSCPKVSKANAGVGLEPPTYTPLGDLFCKDE